MIIIRLVLFAIVCFAINYLAQIGSTVNSNASAVVGYVLLKTVFCLIVYIYGKWFVFVYRKSLGRTRFIMFFDFVLLPILSVNILSVSALMNGLFSPFIVMLWFIAILVNFDRNSHIENFLWEFRQYDFKRIPDDGNVTKKELDSLFTRTMLLLIALPIAGLVFL